MPYIYPSPYPSPDWGFTSAANGVSHRNSMESLSGYDMSGRVPLSKGRWDSSGNTVRYCPLSPLEVSLTSALPFIPTTDYHLVPFDRRVATPRFISAREPSFPYQQADLRHPDDYKTLAFKGLWDAPAAHDIKTLAPPPLWTEDEVLYAPADKAVPSIRPAQPIMPSYLDAPLSLDQYPQHEHDIKPYVIPQPYGTNNQMPQPPPPGAFAEPGFEAYAQTYHGVQPMGYRAPLLHPRLVQLPEHPITPHDTYRYPASHVEQLYIAPIVEGPSQPEINAAFSLWYAEQVIDILVKPGQFRPGVGGQSDEIWGLGGREKDAFLRVGRSPPDYSKPWGRMGMVSTPAPVTRKPRVRNSANERRDPYQILWKHQSRADLAFCNFVQDMLTRMSITPTAVLAAVWFLLGLGLHEGDGQKGSELRQVLEDYYWADTETLAVEKRVATLGLVLAGKWLDDNSFLTKSWTEVTSIPIAQIDRMERAALQDLHFSLHVPLTAWVDHVNKIWAGLYARIDAQDTMDRIVLDTVNGMVDEARDCELKDISSPISRLSSGSPAFPGAHDIDNVHWAALSRDYNVGMDAEDVDEELAYAARNVSALVDDDDGMEDEEEEFLDYDGAKRWLPSIAELKRTASNSSTESIEAWRRTVGPANSKAVRASHDFDAQPYDVTGRALPAAVYRSTHGDCSTCVSCERRAVDKSFSTSGAVTPPSFQDAGHYLEPGISVFRPTAAAAAVSKTDASRDFFSDYFSDLVNAKGWASSRW
jgi:hypothetical protein